MKIRRVLLIVRRTEFADLAKGPSRRDARIRKLLASNHASVSRIQPAHAEHLSSVKLVRRELRARKIDVVERETPPERQVRGFDLVVSIGGDGTLLEASHAVHGKTPLLGVNSAPAFSVGFLTGCRAPTFASTLESLIEDRLTAVEVQRLKVRIGKIAVPEPVLNDALFCEDNPAVTTRYRLISPDGEEVQRSSGIWVAAPAGSTAATRSAGGPTLTLTAKQFVFVVREPYAPPGAGVQLTSGVLDRNERLVVECRSHKASVFLDGHHRRYTIPFGERVSFTLQAKPLRLVRLKALMAAHRAE